MEVVGWAPARLKQVPSECSITLGICTRYYVEEEGTVTINDYQPMPISNYAIPLATFKYESESWR